MGENDKIKLNWFLYEFACSMFEHIQDSRNKTLVKWKSRRSEEQVAEFCAYYSKRMRQSIFDRLSGKTEQTEADDAYVSDYCHTNTQKENDAIINTAADAWEELLGACSVCPTRCISERFRRCELFDRTERGDYFS